MTSRERTCRYCEGGTTTPPPAPGRPDGPPEVLAVLTVSDTTTPLACRYIAASLRMGSGWQMRAVFDERVGSGGNCTGGDCLTLFEGMATPGTVCTLTFGGGMLDETGEAVPSGQRTFTLELTGP